MLINHIPLFRKERDNELLLKQLEVWQIHSGHNSTTGTYCGFELVFVPVNVWLIYFYIFIHCSYFYFTFQDHLEKWYTLWISIPAYLYTECNLPGTFVSWVCIGQLLTLCGPWTRSTSPCIGQSPTCCFTEFLPYCVIFSCPEALSHTYFKPEACYPE